MNMCPLKDTNTAQGLTKEEDHEKVVVNITLRFLFPKLKFFEKKEKKRINFGTIRNHKSRREQTQHATFPSGIQEQPIRSHISPPPPHPHSETPHSLVSAPGPGSVGFSIMIGPVIPSRKSVGLNKNGIQKRSFNFRLCTTNPLPREALCCVSRLHGEKINK